MRSIVYYEMGHSQPIVQSGCGFWTQYRYAVVLKIRKLDQSEYRPYDSGTYTGSTPFISTEKCAETIARNDTVKEIMEKGMPQQSILGK